MEKLIKKYPISCSDIDMDYHVTLPAFLHYIQDCIQHFFAIYKMAAFDVDAIGKMWVITDYHIKLQHEKPYWGSEVEIQLWASEITPIRFYFDFRIVGSDGKEVGVGNSTWATIDAETFRPSNSAELFAPVTQVNELVLGSHPKLIFPTATEAVAEYSYKTRMTDVDFNSHISNRVYLATALGGMPLDWERSHTPVSFYIRFIKQTHFDDTLTCSVYPVDKPSTALEDSEYKRENYLHVLRNSLGEDVCKIWTCWEEQQVNHEAIRTEYIDRK